MLILYDPKIKLKPELKLKTRIKQKISRDISGYTVLERQSLQNISRCVINLINESIPKEISD